MRIRFICRFPAPESVKFRHGSEYGKNARRSQHRSRNRRAFSTGPSGNPLRLRRWQPEAASQGGRRHHTTWRQPAFLTVRRGRPLSKRYPLNSFPSSAESGIRTKICQKRPETFLPTPDSRREGVGREKRLARARLSPVQTTLKHPICRASPRNGVSARQAAKWSKNTKRSFRRKAGRSLRVFAALSPRAGRPQPSPTPPRTRHRHLAGRRGCGGRRTRHPPPTTTQRSPTRHLAGRRGCGGRRTRHPPPTTTRRLKARGHAAV